jgi:hypothetical protein
VEKNKRWVCPKKQVMYHTKSIFMGNWGEKYFEELDATYQFD